MNNVILFVQALCWVLLEIGVPVLVVYFLFLLNEVPLGATSPQLPKRKETL